MSSAAAAAWVHSGWTWRSSGALSAPCLELKRTKLPTTIHLQRLLEATFRLDMEAAREFCAADDRWAPAVEFLDAGGGAGWDLIKVRILSSQYTGCP